MKAKSKPIPINRPPDKVLPATTTHEQNLVTQGQRTINELWEGTQSFIAKAVVVFTVLVNGALSVILVITKTDATASQVIGLSFLNMICGIVISFYFSRTNHAQIGGIGAKPTDTQVYQGR